MENTDNLVRVVTGTAGEPHIELAHPGAPPVRLFGHPNVALVNEQAAAVRAFLAAVVGAADAGEAEKG